MRQTAAPQNGLQTVLSVSNAALQVKQTSRSNVSLAGQWPVPTASTVQPVWMVNVCCIVDVIWSMASGEFPSVCCPPDSWVILISCPNAIPRVLLFCLAPLDLKKQVYIATRLYLCFEYPLASKSEIWNFRSNYSQSFLFLERSDFWFFSLSA